MYIDKATKKESFGGQKRRNKQRRGFWKQSNMFFALFLVACYCDIRCKGLQEENFLIIQLIRDETSTMWDKQIKNRIFCEKEVFITVV